jgi:hypothetical protein
VICARSAPIGKLRGCELIGTGLPARHSGASRNPGKPRHWIPAFAGVTNTEIERRRIFHSLSDRASEASHDLNSLLGEPGTGRIGASDAATRVCAYHFAHESNNF